MKTALQKEKRWTKTENMACSSILVVVGSAKSYVDRTDKKKDQEYASETSSKDAEEGMLPANFFRIINYPYK